MLLSVEGVPPPGQECKKGAGKVEGLSPINMSASRPKKPDGIIGWDNVDRERGG
jgi:hypothetical protein